MYEMTLFNIICKQYTSQAIAICVLGSRVEGGTNTVVPPYLITQEKYARFCVVEPTVVLFSLMLGF